MSKANPHFKKIKTEHIFPFVEKKIEEALQNNPNAKLLNFGIGDVVLPLKPLIAKAISSAIIEMTGKVHGYGSSFGEPFLKEALVHHEYGKYGLSPDEIFISDGTISDATGILDLFDAKSKVAVMDPTYPVYVDACVLSGKTKPLNTKGMYPHLLYLPCIEKHHFIPNPPQKKCDLIYLCSPNNPTGVALTKEALQAFVNYALKYEAILLLDAAYAAFIQDDDVPTSIYEIPGAKEVAIEMRTFSKSAGFSGLRCSYMVIPHTLKARIGEETISLNALWKRRQVVKFNGVAYPIQKGAEAALSPEGIRSTMEDIRYYLKNTALFKKALIDLGYSCFGGVNSPYIWCKTPPHVTSKEFFEYLLHELGIITVPGSGFGPCGEGFIRISGFTIEENVHEALDRLKSIKKKPS